MSTIASTGPDENQKPRSSPGSQCLCDQAVEVTLSPLHAILWGTETNPDTKWKGATPWHEYRKSSFGESNCSSRNQSLCMISKTNIQRQAKLNYTVLFRAMISMRRRAWQGEREREVWRFDHALFLDIGAVIRLFTLQNTYL